MARFDAGWYVPSSIFPGSNILDVPKQRIQCDPCLPFYEINQLFELGSLLFSFEVVISRGPPFFLKLEGKFHYYLFHIGWAVHFIPEFDILLCITTSSYRKLQRHAKLFCLHSWWCCNSKFSPSKQQQSKADSHNSLQAISLLLGILFCSPYTDNFSPILFIGLLLLYRHFSDFILLLHYLN